MGQADGEDCQTFRGSAFESRPNVEAIDKLLREQEFIEERRREENSKKYILDQEVRHCKSDTASKPPLTCTCAICVGNATK